MSSVRTGDVVCGRRTVGGERVTGTLVRVFNDGQSLVQSGADEHYTVSTKSLFKPLAR